LTLLLKIFDIASDIDSSGDGVTGEPNGLLLSLVLVAEGGTDIGLSSKARAVVAAALGCGAATDPRRAGLRPPENLEVIDRRDAREPGRKGDGKLGV